MAESEPSIFNKKATERLRNPDDLDRYVRVTRPSVWALLGACALLIVGLMVWGIYGTVNVSVNGVGVRTDEKVCCFVNSEDKARLQEGNTAQVEDVQLKVSSISKVPLSPDEVRAVVGSDYLVNTLTKGDDWVFEVDFEGEKIENLEENVPLGIGITTERISPFDLIFGKEW